MGKKIDLNSEDIDNLIKPTGLSLGDQRVLKDCIFAYHGDKNLHFQLIDFSKFFKKKDNSNEKTNNGVNKTKSENASEIFKKFLRSFEKSSMCNSSNNSYEINYFDFTNLSPNK